MHNFYCYFCYYQNIHFIITNTIIIIIIIVIVIIIIYYKKIDCLALVLHNKFTSGNTQ